MSELSQGTTINGRYTLQEYKGSGSFGEVWLAHDDIIDTDVALKIYVSLNPAGISQFTEEYKTTANLSHPNLLTAKHFDVWERRPFLEMKYCGQGSADKLVGNITEKDLWHFIHDVAAGLHYLHDLPEPIIHQDIKPDNVLMDDDGMFLITDFGISKQLRATIRKQSGRSDASGSCAYMGPERFNADPTPIKASDIWSLGASIYELAKGELPFYGQGGVMLKNGADLPELGAGWSSELNQTIQACLAKDPWDRPTAEQLEKYAESMLQSLEAGQSIATAHWIKGNKKPTTAKPSAGNATVPINKQETPNKVSLTSKEGNTSSNTKGNLWLLLLIPLIALGTWGIIYSINKGESNPTYSPSSLTSLPSSKVTIKRPDSSSNSHNGHKYVDLGLPSGTLWATCNVGANRPEEYGNYYAWGETSNKYNYSNSTYSYNYSYSQLPVNDDAAYVNWGGKWRMPTYNEHKELLNNCIWTWTIQKGVIGYKITSRNNRNSIFLPAAGYWDGTKIYHAGRHGSYWSMTPCESSAWSIFFQSTTHYQRQSGRCYGRTIRAVCKL